MANNDGERAFIFPLHTSKVGIGSNANVSIFEHSLRVAPRS